MIGRYTRPEMGAIWELQNKFEIWKEIEVLACEAQAELGKSGITKEEAAWIRKHADFTVERIDEVEKVTNHDVIAFTTNMAEYIDADVPEGTEPPSRWVHYGMTSSDLGDTALSYQITQALDIILKDVALLGETCKRRAFRKRKLASRLIEHYVCRSADSVNVIPEIKDIKVHLENLRLVVTSLEVARYPYFLQLS